VQQEASWPRGSSCGRLSISRASSNCSTRTRDCPHALVHRESRDSNPAHLRQEKCAMMVIPIGRTGSRRPGRPPPGNSYVGGTRARRQCRAMARVSRLSRRPERAALAGLGAAGTRRSCDGIRAMTYFPLRNSSVPSPSQVYANGGV
jgi:hypothetical protein